MVSVSNSPSHQTLPKEAEEATSGLWSVLREPKVVFEIDV